MPVAHPRFRPAHSIGHDDVTAPMEKSPRPRDAVEGSMPGLVLDHARCGRRRGGAAGAAPEDDAAGIRADVPDGAAVSTVEHLAEEAAGGEVRIDAGTLIVSREREGERERGWRCGGKL